MKIALIGANGLLGTDIVKVFPEEGLFPLTHKDIEIVDPKSIKRVLSKIKPNVVINTAAYNQVDNVESNLRLAFNVNETGAKNLAEYCKKKDIVLVHISTDYVFSGLERNTPYTELDHPYPLSLYGFSKLRGELQIKITAQKYFIIRTGGLFGTGRNNFVELMLKLVKEGKQIKVVNDQIVSPTYTMDLARQILKLIQTDNYGVYHATAQGRCTWYEFAMKIFRITKQQVNLKAVTSEEFGAVALRPKYSVLSNEKLKKLGLYEMPVWQEGLIKYLYERSI